MIKVLGRRNSVNVQKVMWAIGEMGLTYERHDVAGSFGITDGYLALNPRGTVPTIQDGDLTLFESNACVRYLARKYGVDSLWPDDVSTSALADQWMDFQSNVFNQPFFQIFANTIRLPIAQQKPEQVAGGVKTCGKLLQQMDQHLSGKAFLTGDQFTMADIPLGAMMYRYFTLDIERPGLPNVEAWYQRLTDRPAYRYHVMIPFGTNNDEWLVEEQTNAGLQ